MDNTDMIAEVDTPENREQAIYDIAKLTERMIMRNRTHGGYRVLLDDLRKFVEEFNADMVILWEHMSCKALDGMHGLFEQRAVSSASILYGSLMTCLTRVWSPVRAFATR